MAEAAGPYAQMLSQAGSRLFDAWAQGARRCARGVAAALDARGTAVTAEEARQRYERFLRDEAPRLLGRATQEAVDYYTATLDLGWLAVDRFVDQVVRGQAVAPGAGAAPPAPALLFQGPAGASVRNAFVVANHRGEAVDVRFELSAFKGDDGVARPAGAANFEPASLNLPAHGEVVVSLSLVLGADWPPGIDQRAQVSVLGFPGMTVPVTARIDKTQVHSNAIGAAIVAPRTTPAKVSDG